MKYIYILFLIFPSIIFSQLTIEPSVTYYATNLSSDRESSNKTTFFENNFAYAFGIGIDLKHQLKKNLYLNYGLTSSFVVHNSKHFTNLSFTNEISDTGIEKTALSRWDYHAGLGFHTTKYLFLQFNTHVINQPYRTHTTFSDRFVLGVVEVGFSGKVSFQYKKLQVGIFYYYGINNIGNPKVLYKPFKSIGVECRYQFDINKKEKQKSRRK